MVILHDNKYVASRHMPLLNVALDCATTWRMNEKRPDSVASFNGFDPPGQPFLRAIAVRERDETLGMSRVGLETFETHKLLAKCLAV